MKTETILVILDMVAKYGVPAIVNIIKEFNKETITEEDINNLKNKIKQNPEDYFK